ncbi:LacI family DNA-binding transcriptional regulator [Microlunatus sp. Gsoil 973]|uniref:LacI family DNA-binding transcriptional regulator n=1 Tax=Microlunatus sp. Gsoil 973 TaxID=2672569 RepID=UPI0012B4F9AC|nr:LacI family DNA-binding transcriptional regulator [Microlunatus sp. Gsoil 973]QGN33266.1 LacI family DNA-binding transcriptional regulator [Microlunatus sp. Gsoil 973]
MARPRREPRRVSQADVARRADVSTGIVSSVINGRDYGSIRVSEATRQRVWAAVRELGYVPNLAARNLARGTNRLIGVFTYQPVFPYESRDFYHDFLTGVEEAAEQLGYNLLMITGARNDQGHRSVYAGGVNNLQLADGAVLVGAGEDVDELTRMTQEGYPFVYIGQRRPAGVDLSFVAADYRGGTSAIVRRLHALGHRRIALVQVAGEAEPVPARRPGFLDACRELGIAEDHRPRYSLGGHRGDTDRAQPVDGPTELITELQRTGCTAVVAERSADASLIRDAAVNAGLEVPRDLSLVSLAVPPLPSEQTGLAQLEIPRREMGRQAVSILLELLQPGARTPIRVTLPCGLQEGKTLARPRSSLH